MTLPFPGVMNGWCLWCQCKHPLGLRIKNSTHTGRCWYIRTQPTSIPSENLLLHSSPIQPKPKRGKCCHYFLGGMVPWLSHKASKSLLCVYVCMLRLELYRWTHFTVNPKSLSIRCRIHYTQRTSIKVQGSLSESDIQSVLDITPSKGLTCPTFYVKQDPLIHPAIRCVIFSIISFHAVFW